MMKFPFDYTAFIETVNGDVYQEVLDNVAVYEEIDLIAKPLSLFEEYKLQEAGWRFNLSKPPLLRVKLLF